MSKIKAIDACLSQLNKIILGKEQANKLAVTCLLAKGHLLIEDLPGMGKTTLSHALSNCLGLSYRRIQFTNDLLPADLLGLNIFDKNEGTFHFHPGPIFSNIILGDEINRAADVSTRIVNCAASTLALTVAEHDGKIVELDRAAGIAVTLPSLSAANGAIFKLRIN